MLTFSLAPWFGISFIKADPTMSYYCQFYPGKACAGNDLIGISSTDNIEDLTHFSVLDLDWNDRINSYFCDVKLNKRETPSVVIAKTTNEFAPFDATTIINRRGDLSDDAAQSPTEYVKSTLYTDTEYHGFSLLLSAKPDVCVKISKNDGSGQNFGLSSVMMDSVSTQVGKKVYVAYCNFYGNDRCDSDSWKFTVGNNVGANDLNNVHGLPSSNGETNVNDRIWGTICTWKEVAS